MAGVQVTNNAVSTLAGSINAVVTTLSVQAGHGTRFPSASLVSGNYFYVTLIDSANNLEIVKVTDRTVDVFTIIRARDGTTAKSFVANDRIELRPVAALFSDLPNRLLQTADYADLSITVAKLAAMGTVSPNTYGGLGRTVTITVNSKGLITALTEANAVVQQDTYNYTGAPQTWNKPSGRGVWARIQEWGAGGGGARASAGNGAGGGGGGGYKEAWVLLTDLAATATINPGQGGAAASVNNTNGTDGGDTTFVSGTISLTAYGGKAGNATAAARNGGNGGGIVLGGIGGVGGEATTPTPPIVIKTPWDGGGGGCGSDVNSIVSCHGGAAINGGGGGGGAADNTDAGGNCVGGVSELGGSGGRGSVDQGGTPVAATAGSAPGGGGGGAENSAAGAGASGRVVVTVY